MKAILLHETGGVEQLTIGEVDKPDLQVGEVLVRVRAFSINPVDIKTRTGKGVYGRIKEQMPLILGWDISGEVVEAGKEVTQFKPGDEVFGMVNFLGHGKAYAEYVAVPESQLATKPADVSHEAAAAATLAALTAWQVLVDQARIQSGQRVLIHAAAGGVGHFAVQIAKHHGAYVIGTASETNFVFLKSIGVDEMIDYRNQRFEQVAHDIDIVLDPIGGETTRQSINTLKPGGVLVSIVGGANEEVHSLAAGRDIQAINYLVHSSGDDMQELARLLEQQLLVPHIHQVYTFDEIAKAHQQIETGRTIGKVVVSAF